MLHSCQGNASHEHIEADTSECAGNAAEDASVLEDGVLIEEEKQKPATNKNSTEIKAHRPFFNADNASISIDGFSLSSRGV